jgi:hypothetical protein
VCYLSKPSMDAMDGQSQPLLQSSLDAPEACDVRLSDSEHRTHDHQDQPIDLSQKRSTLRTVCPYILGPW